MAAWVGVGAWAALSPCCLSFSSPPYSCLSPSPVFSFSLYPSISGYEGLSQP